MWIIYKYKLPSLGGELNIEIPEKGRICDINCQGEDIYMWCVVNTDSPMIKRKIVTIGTGWEISNPDNMMFLKTVHMPNGLVCHVMGIVDEEEEPKDAA